MAGAEGIGSGLRARARAENLNLDAFRYKPSRFSALSADFLDDVADITARLRFAGANEPPPLDARRSSRR
jgi:hypothetical protein